MPGCQGGAPAAQRGRTTLTATTARPPATRRTGDGSAFGACCSAGKLRSPAPRTGEPASPGPTHGGCRYVNPHAIPYARTYGNPYARHPRTPCWPERGITAGRAPKGGQSPAKTAGDWPPSGELERPRRKERFARLIQRRVRAFERTFGPRRLRRQSKPAA
jgi:hypothetical protein